MKLNNDQYQLLKTLRQTLHADPELSGQEKNTAAIIKDFLQKHTSSEIIEEVGGNGLVAVFKGENDGAVLVFRAELDALPIEESSGVEYKSKKKNIAHSCGHDGHSTILCGLALRLEELRPENGTVLLLFQPSEETGEGAARVIGSESFSSLNPDQIVALHNIPGEKTGTIIWKNGVMCAASTGVRIHLKGETTHAAHQELGVSPWQALSAIAKEAEALPNTMMPLGDVLRITVVGMNMGGPYYGTAPGDADIWLTIRSFETETLNRACEILEKRVQKISLAYGLRFEIEYEESFDATVNDEELMTDFVKLIDEAGLHTREKSEPYSWSEDFGKFTSSYKGFLFGLGAGTDCPALHSSDYDFPDELIRSGVHAFETYLRNQLK